uniref:Uncharacterized protein n=1 Tax=Cyanistes caeruleus TaxID=156563 RepID=A0A8C0ZA27_CYACU
MLWGRAPSFPWKFPVFPPDSLGFIFDVRSGAVRAQGGCSENMKEKVQVVRAVVPQPSTP